MTLNNYVGLWPDRLDEVARNLDAAREKAVQEISNEQQ